MILTQQEIEEITQKKRPAWQARVLDRLGIPYKRRPDGSIVVSRSAAEKALRDGWTRLDMR